MGRRQNPPPSNLTDEEYLRWIDATFPNGAGIIQPLVDRLRARVAGHVPLSEVKGCCPVCGTELTFEDENG